MATFNFGQWKLEVNEKEGTYEFTNPGDDGKPRFYKVVPGKYGQPLIIPEPELAFAVPSDLVYVNGKGEVVVPEEKISGIICQDGPRFSLSNARKQGVDIKVNDDGSLSIGEEVWWLATLFSKDKNRVFNYDAYLVQVKPDQVRVLELGDIDLFG